MNRTRTIVIAFSTLDGIVEDPDGRDGTPNGGWAFRHGPEAVAGDKLVVTSTVADLSAWQNSSLLTGDLENAVAKHLSERDLIIVGSASIVHHLAEQNLIDEYRIMVFPELIGRGTKLFPAQTAPAQLRLRSADVVGPSVLMRYERIGLS